MYSLCFCHLVEILWWITIISSLSGRIHYWIWLRLYFMCSELLTIDSIFFSPSSIPIVCNFVILPQHLNTSFLHHSIFSQNCFIALNTLLYFSVFLFLLLSFRSFYDYILKHRDLKISYLQSTNKSSKIFFLQCFWSPTFIFEYFFEFLAYAYIVYSCTLSTFSI